MPIRLGQFAMILLLVAAWHFASGDTRKGALIDSLYVGTPEDAWDALVDWIRTGVIWGHTWATLYETITGFAIGCIGGVLTGFLLGISERASRLCFPFVTAANSVPKLALAPLFLLWFGLGQGSKIALVAAIVFFLVFYNTFSGAREVDQSLVDVVRIMGAKPWQRHLKVTLPSAAVWVIAGLRVSVPYAFVGAVVGEMISSDKGLGTLIQRSSQAFDPSAMFAAIFVLVLLSVAINAAVSLIERFVLRWRISTERSKAGKR